MKGNRAAIRYARSLFLFSKEENKLEVVLDDAKMILSLVNENRELDLLFKSPLIKMDKKLSIVNAMFSGRVDKLTLNFINLITKHKREGIIEPIFLAFVEKYNQLNNIATVNVSTAVKLSDTLKKEIIEKFKSILNYTEVHLNEEVDKNLLGGVVLRIDDKQLDGSIRRQLKDIKQKLVLTK